MMKSYPFAFVLSLMLALAHPGSADARPSSSSSSSHSSSSSSFKSGFSSQRASSAPSYASSKSSAAPASSSGGSGGFGSFGRRPASAAATNEASNGAPNAAPAPGRSSGGFGSFGSGRPVPQKSDSALSQQLDRKTAEANALRTLDARRQAQADAARDTRPVPGYEGGAGAQGHAAPGYVPPMAPQQQAPVVVRQDSGLGHVVAGAVLANAMRGAHANNNGYPGSYGNAGGYGNTGGHAGHGAGGGSSFLGLFMTLCVLALLAWGAYFLWRRVRRARDAKKPNYSFKGN